MKQLSLIAVLLLMGLVAAAQSDTTRRDGYIPLFDNLTSPDVPLPEDFNGKLRIANAADSTEISIEDAVRTLRTLYDAGRFHEAFLYAFYLRSRQEEDKFTKDDSETFRKYTIASMKEMHFDRKADSLMKLFCTRNPFYEPKPGDPDAFLKLKDKFVTRPIIGIRVSSSIDYPMVKLDTVYTVRDKEAGYQYENFKGSSYGVDVVFYPIKKLEVSAGVMSSKFGFTRTERSSDHNFIYTEDDKLFSIPIEAGYSLPPFLKVVSPEFYAGARLSMLRKSSYKVKDRTVKVLNLGFSTPEDVDCEGEYDDIKNSFVTLYGGFRLNYEIRRVCFFAGLQYGVALGELRNPEDNYKNLELLVNHRFMPDAMRVGQFSINVGVKVNLFYKIAKYGYGY